MVCVWGRGGIASRILNLLKPVSHPGRFIFP